jgi:hypothetical protein
MRVDIAFHSLKVGRAKSSEESMDDKTNIKFRSNQHSIKIVGL